MAKNEGFIPIYRSIFEHEFWTAKREFSKFEAWMWLIKEARYTDKPGRRLISGKWITYKKGEIPASLEYLRRAWNWGSTGKVDRFLKNLSEPGKEDDPMIYIDNSQGVNVIGLVKHAEYNPHLYEDAQKQLSVISDRPPQKQSASSAKSVIAGQKSSSKNKQLKTLTKQLVDYWNECNDTRLTPEAKGREVQVRQRLKTFDVKDIKKAIYIRAAQPWTRENDQQGNWDALMKSDKALDQWLNRSLPDEEKNKNTPPDQRGFFLKERCKQICEQHRKEFNESNVEYTKHQGKFYYKPLFPH